MFDQFSDPGLSCRGRICGAQIKKQFDRKIWFFTYVGHFLVPNPQINPKTDLNPRNEHSARC